MCVARDAAGRGLRIALFEQNDLGGAAKSMDDLGPVFGDDLTGAEVSYLMREEFVRFADGIVWRRSKFGLTMSRQDRGALATFMATA